MKKHIFLIGSFLLIFILNACTSNTTPVASQTQLPITTQTNQPPAQYVKPLAKITNETKGILYYVTSYTKPKVAGELKTPTSTLFLYDPKINTTIELLEINTYIFNPVYYKNHLYLAIKNEKDEWITKDYSLQNQTEITIPVSMDFFIMPTDKIVYKILNYDNYDGTTRPYPDLTIVFYDINKKTTENLEISDKYVLERINPEGFFFGYNDKTNEISILSGFWEMGTGNAIKFNVNVANDKINNIKEASNGKWCESGDMKCVDDEEFSTFIDFPDKKTYKCLNHIISEEVNNDVLLVKKNNTEQRIENANYVGCIE